MVVRSDVVVRPPDSGAKRPLRELFGYHHTVRTVLTRISPVLRLTRVTSGFAAIGNVWFVILWTRLHAEESWNSTILEEPLWLLLLGGCLAAVGLYAFGASLNDLVDLRRDRVLRPERPLAAGRLTPTLATAVVAGTMVMAVLGATIFGTAAVVLTLGLAVAILAYTLAARFVPGIGLVLLGLVYAGHMLVPNLGLKFLWPVWGVMTHALLVAAVSHVIGRKIPVLSRRAAIACVAGWAFWSILMLWWGTAANEGEIWPAWVPVTSLLWIAGIGVAFGLFIAYRLSQPGTPERHADRVVRYGTLWLPLYGAGWMFGQRIDGSVQAGAMLLGIALISLLGMTVLRELYGLSEQPIGYRR